MRKTSEHKEKRNALLGGNRMKQMALFLLLLFAGNMLQAQIFPPASSCSSKELDWLEGLLQADNGVATSAGNRKMRLTVSNKTTSDRRSFAVWGKLNRYDSYGKLKSTQPIFLCADSVRKNSTVTLPTKDSIFYGADEIVEISNIYFAWSSATGKENCDFLYANSANIAPRCAVRDRVRVYTGVNGRFHPQRASCGNGKGLLKAVPFGGKAPYVISVSLVGSTTQVTQTVTDSANFELPPGIYKVTVVDGKSNSSIFTREIEAPLPTDKPQMAVKHPDCNMPKGWVNVINKQIGFSYQLKQSGLTIATSDNGEFADVETGAYQVVAVRGNCSNADSVKINRKPNVPGKPQFNTEHPSCTKSKGKISLMSREADVTYTLKQNGEIKYTADENGEFLDVEPGTYIVEAKGAECSNSENGNVNQQPPAPVTPSVSVNNEPSFCAASGAVTITNPVQQSFEYSRDGGKTWQSSNQFTGIQAGDGSALSFKVKNQHGCESAVASVTCGSSETTTSTQSNTVAGEQTAPKYLGSAELSETTVSIKAIPNPFGSKVRFMINAPSSGNGVLEIFNMQGQKVKTVYQGFISAGTNFFDLSMPGNRRAELVYVLRIGNEKVSGKLLQMGNEKF